MRRSTATFLVSGSVLLALVVACTGGPSANSPQAIATRVAPTVIAAATSSALSPVQITAVSVEPADTTIMVKNGGASTVKLDDWTLLLGPSIQLTLPPISIDPGETKTLHVGAGKSTTSDIYLNSSAAGVAMTFAPGQRAVLVGPNDTVASVYQVV